MIIKFFAFGPTLPIYLQYLKAWGLILPLGKARETEALVEKAEDRPWITVSEQVGRKGSLHKIGEQSGRR